MESFTSCLLLSGVLVSVLSPIWALTDHLSISECMPMSQEVGRISSVSMSPYPPRLPGTVTLSATVLLNRPVLGDISMSVEMRKKTLFLGYALVVPCINNVGSCTYADVCSLFGRSSHTTTTTAPPTTTETTTPLPPTTTETATPPPPTTTETTPPPPRTTETTTPPPPPTTTETTPLPQTTPAGLTVSAVGTDHSASPSGNPAQVSSDSAALQENNDSTTLDASAVSSSEQPSTSSSGQPSSFVSVAARSAGLEICSKVLAPNNIPCQCPFDAGLYSIPPTSFEIPDLGPLGSFAVGDYQAKLSFHDTNTGRMLMCQVIEFSISQSSSPCTGFACIIG